MKKQPGWQIVSLILGGLLTASPLPTRCLPTLADENNIRRYDEYR